MYIILSALFTVLAFTQKNEIAQSLFCIASAILISLLVRHSKRVITSLALYSLAIHLVAFYWLPQTMKTFGGFDDLIAWAIHILFSLTATIQWVLIGVLVRWLRGRTGILAFPLAYSLTDFTMPQMFPWSFANPLITFHPLSAYAEIFGSKGVSFILLVLAAQSVDAIYRKGRRPIYIASIAIVLIVGAGLDYRAKESLKNSSTIKLGLVQGNISIEQKSDRNFFEYNLKTFKSLSQVALGQGAEFIIWPETTIEEWTPVRIPSLRGTKFDPTDGVEMNLLYGLLSYEGRNREELKQYNSAFLVNAKGEVQGSYSKKILMPFGEYLPFESLFPWLRDFSPMTGQFEAGTSSAPLELQLSDKMVKPAVLICYEDLVPSLSRTAVSQEGNILVNITNDSWYGDTAAQWQHSLLASWRTVENRRTLVRATNTGLTTIISPRGDTNSRLDTFMQGVLVDTAQSSTVKTVYTEYGDGLSILLIAIIATVSIIRAGHKN